MIKALPREEPIYLAENIEFIPKYVEFKPGVSVVTIIGTCRQLIDGKYSQPFEHKLVVILDRKMTDDPTDIYNAGWIGWQII